MALTWTVNIKWDGTNNVNEASYLQHLRASRGRRNLVRSGGEGFEPQMIGEAVLTLNNNDGRYDPLNSSSAIYPNVAPGKQVTISVSDGTSYSVFRGHIFDIQPIRGTSGAKRTRIIVRDGWQWLKERLVRYAATANVNTGTAISNLLTAAQYPYSTSIETGSDTIPYWWASNKNAKDEIQSIADSEFGLLYCARDGTITFKNRPNQWTGTSATTYTGAEITEVDMAMPWDVMRNVVQIKTYPTSTIPYLVGTNLYLWRCSKIFKIRAGKTITLTGEYTYQGQKVIAIDIIPLTATTDYSAYANSNGTGDNLTASIGVTFTNKGEEGQFVLINNGTRAAFVSLLQVRGTALLKSDSVIIESDVSGGSNRRTFLLDVPWQQNVEDADIYSDHLANYMSAARRVPTIRTNTETGTLARQMAEISTVQTLNISQIGVNAAFRIGGVEHEWDAHSPNLIWSNIYFEHKDTTTYFTLNSSTLNSSDKLAY